MKANEIKTILDKLCKSRNLEYFFENDDEIGLFFRIRPKKYERSYLTDYQGCIVIDGSNCTDWTVSIDGLFKKFEFVDNVVVLEYLISALIPDMHYPCAEKEIFDQERQKLEQSIANGTYDPYA
jgi:hypothetical protein